MAGSGFGQILMRDSGFGQILRRHAGFGILGSYRETEFDSPSSSKHYKS